MVGLQRLQRQWRQHREACGAELIHPRTGDDGAGVREPGGAVVEEADNGKGNRDQRHSQRHFQLRSVQALSHNWCGSFTQRRCGASGLRLRQGLGFAHRQVRTPEAAFHSTGEHRHSDLRGRRLRDCFQQYALSHLFL